jgi:hypothetical protein
MMKPTVGRKVWYRPSKFDLTGPGAMQIAGSLDAGNSQPLDATVIAVWGDRMVNVLVTDIVGKQFPLLSVTFVQEGDTPPTDAEGQELGRYVYWMPYQIAQSK